MLLGLALLVLPACDLLEKFRPAATSGNKNEGVAEPAAVKVMSPREKFGFYRWLVNEMQEQIFARPVKDPASLDAWANVLTQRGSVEGVYHGFVLSRDYLTLEEGKKADIQALRFFGLEMALMDLPFATEQDEKVKAAAARYVKESMSLSFFTLKKNLGERILQEATKRKGQEEKLAAWYSGIVARWAKLDIPFGLAQRNEKSEVFHFEWARQNTLGMLEWELLNRSHRIFNQLGGVGLPAKAPMPKSANPAGM